MQSNEQCRAWVEIDPGAIAFNVRSLLNWFPEGTHLMAIVKADGYGHGLLTVARAAVEAGASWLGVATVDEGIQLREAGYTTPICLICAPAPLPEESERLLRNQLTPLVGDCETLDSLAQARQHPELRYLPASIHLEVDTGMGRAGVAPGLLVPLLEQARQANLPVEGLMTHFSDAENRTPDGIAFFQRQIELYEQGRKALEAAGANLKWTHANNAPGTLLRHGSGGNLCRPGLLLYGIRPGLPDNSFPDSPGPELMTALQLKARIATVRQLPVGSTISYGRTHTLRRDSMIATVLIGYGDGYPRRLSNKGSVLIHGQRAPILGRVCMDQIVVDVTDISGVTAGEIATCIGSEGLERITIEELARLVDTTEHEIPTCLTSRLPRIIVTS